MSGLLVEGREASRYESELLPCWVCGSKAKFDEWDDFSLGKCACVKCPNPSC